MWNDPNSEITVFFLTESENRGFGTVTDEFKAFKSDETQFNNDRSKAPHIAKHESAIHPSVNRKWKMYSK